MNLFGLWNRVCQKTITAERVCIILILTVIYISFAKIFCQNLVKKNCKFVSPVSIKKADVRREKRYGNILSDEPEAGHAVVMKI